MQSQRLVLEYARRTLYAFVESLLSGNLAETTYRAHLLDFWAVARHGIFPDRQLRRSEYQMNVGSLIIQ